MTQKKEQPKNYARKNFISFIAWCTNFDIKKILIYLRKQIR